MNAGQNVSLFFVSFICMSLTSLILLFSPALYYINFYEKEKGIIKKIKYYSGFTMFTLFSFLVLLVILLIPLTILKLYSVNLDPILSTTPEVIIQEAEKVYLGYGVFEWIKVIVFSVFTFLLVILSLFSIISTHFNLKIFKLSFAQSLRKSFSGTLRHFSFVIIPLILFCVIIISILQIFSVNVAGINIFDLVVKPLLIVFSSHYIYSLYTMVFLKNKV
jgi:hypothetical protein